MSSVAIDDVRDVVSEGRGELEAWQKGLFSRSRWRIGEIVR